ncbi:MAG: 23S rRNA (adenine(1618)-N(6))-methyltransferase RlmF [Bacteroidota bacterium]
MSKQRLHQRNKHQGQYDFKAMIAVHPTLADHLITNKYGNESIDFANPNSVRALNGALLKLYYGLKYWEIPENYLCPPIPGRADYIHHMADLLADCNGGIIPKGNRVRCMDIGTGSSCIYPIIGIHEYEWNFIATETDFKALESVENIIAKNLSLMDKVEIRKQHHSKNVLKDVLSPSEKIDLTVCNPPFHSSAEEAASGSKRKVKNLSKKKTDKPVLNFGGKSHELWCPGGEKQFIKTMISESRKVANACFWFSSLVSKESNLNSIYGALKNAGVTDVRTIPMGQGNKISRIVAWTYYSPQQQQKWRERA